MDLFEFLMILLSLIVGLGLAERKRMVHYVLVPLVAPMVILDTLFISYVIS